ncbi:hydroxyacylglutathione hydrolase [Sinorhizobium fredii]|uniref:MBL fold metallo-hydrolase n=1 Tax=Rhizobium fredii TaxID=380 RepID=UPI000565AA9D|nr:MBL fold metallo-hydrolase [Sinorhizobium fredii]
MIVRQFLHTDPVGISAAGGGRASGAVIDPAGEVEPYPRAAEQTGMRILYIIGTHVHADHVSFGGVLADVAGTVLSAKSNVSLPFKPVHDGDELELGNVVLKVLYTPGHAPEHIRLLVTDLARPQQPWFVVTGHTLIVGDLSRTELAVSAEEGTKNLFRSIERLKALADYLVIMPGAYARSVCGRSLSSKPSSTTGFEKQFNKAFRIETEEEFVVFMTKDIPLAWPRATQLRAIHSGAA